MSFLGGGGPSYTPDPAVQEKKRRTENEAEREAAISANAAAQTSIGRTMGLRGARALLTAGAGGFQRTMGNANTGA